MGGDPARLRVEEARGLGQWLLRNLFGRCRRATVHVYDAAGRPVGRGEKPFRWYFHRMEAFDGDRKVGAVQRKWSWLHRVFLVENAAGQEVMELRSPLFHPWTFTLTFQGAEAGVIRTLLLVATFLIDFTCFENNQGSRSAAMLD